MLLRSIYLLTTSTLAVWAQQAPLTGSKGNCLSSSNANRAAALSTCCPTQATEGKGTVDGTVFTYACGKYASPYESSGQNTASPRDCAQLCAQDPTCVAASWAGRNGLCYVTREGSSFGPRPGENFILMAKTEETPTDDPSLADPAAIAQCNNEKDAIRREMTNQCEMEVQGQKAAHQSALRQAEDRCKEEKAQCEADKSRQVTAARDQCDSDKAALERDREMCETEKSEQSALAEEQCKAQVAGLEKQVKDLQDKVQSGSGSSSGSGSGGSSSGSGGGTGSSSGSGSKGFVVTGDPRCENLSPNAGCEPGCKKFSVDGVEYEHRCDVFAQRTRYLYGGLNQYRSIAECLAYRCNKEANCLGVGWQPNGLCVFHYPTKPGATANVVPMGGRRHNVMKVNP
ncbi:hypothetical protein CGCSCA5_v000392 [Colletotrichum siamense]|nr:hypothetical protein CGCSCA5_v000392 [Colletotrichum siamense]KAI8245423.1 hypothetical protein K4K55_001962 [Colletotrichum sp. SAR 10_96]KAJ4999862.1 hypothetical protein K4K48_003421 [Colletotrichum sp. SAR 10_66]KAJ5019487.1 hypothetical protein K4K57_000166 [Colletotrichum sp. SAR 10_99]